MLKKVKPQLREQSGLLIENNHSGNIDMNIVAKSDFNFQGNALVPVSGISGVWLTSADIAKALQYKSAKSITNLFNQNSDEFTGGMTQVIESVTSGNYRKKVRVFSLRGAHLIAMFARTDVAKEFRRWVLDILDREIGSGVVSPSFDFHMHAHHANVVCIHMDFIREVWINELHPALKAIGSPLAVKLYDRIGDASAIAYSLRGALYRADGRKDLH